MKWFSIKTNPAARYLPQVFSKDEQSLVYRCLHSTAKRTDNRGTSTGAINFEESTEFLRPEQEAILIELAEIPDSFNLKTRHYTIDQVIENNRMLSRKKAYRWATGHAMSDAEFTTWWKRLLPQSQAKRQAAVEALKKERIQSRKYSMPALSGVVGSFSRDANNQWARVAIDHPIKLKHVLPVLQRIDAAFKKALPERWALQKAFVDTLDPRFVIEGTTFTTITVNKNYGTAEHRDAGDLSQGFSNIAVFSNGLPFSGGHLVLPEFNVEICLKPGDLLFVANHEYIHQNTAITQEHPEAERLSLVCYAREGFAFAGTLEYETLRAEFQKKNKKFASMWTSKQWYRFLHQRSGAGNATLVSKARKAGILNREIVLLASLHEKDALLNIGKWQYLASIPLTSPQDLATLRALFSTQHFKTSRQDRWLRENSKEEGAKPVDAVYFHDGWGYAYCETESGAVRLDQNRFNVQSVGKLAKFALPFQKLTRDVFEWLESHWESEQSVHLVRCPTGIPEAPYQYALTTLSKHELRTDPTLQRLMTKPSEQQRFNQSGGNLANRDTLPSLRHNSVLLDLGFAYFPKRQGKLTKEGEATVDSILLSSSQEREYLKEALAHWKRRAKNLGSEDFYTRYERVGNYLPPDRPLNPGEASLPWHWKVEPDAIHLRRYTWQPNKRNTKRLVRGKAVNLFLPSRAASTALSWTSKYQSPLLLAAHVPPTATLGIWRLKNSKSDAAQACLSNGLSIWMFHALGTQVPIRKSDRQKRDTVKVSKPAILGHLQLSDARIEKDTSDLTRRIRQSAIDLKANSRIPRTATQRRRAIADYQIVIPSYGRSSKIGEWTIATLRAYDIDPRKVTIFVADTTARQYKSHLLEELPEPDVYRKRLSESPYGQRIVVGKKGLSHQRNFIQSYFPEGTHLVWFDDDITAVEEFHPTDQGKGIYKPVDSLEHLFFDAFDACHRTGSHLWGIHAARNPMFQASAIRSRGEISTQPQYIIGSFFGIITRQDPTLEVTTEHGEDYERSCKFFAKDLVTVRMMKYTVKTNYIGYGGLEDARKNWERDVRDPIISIASQFPSLCSVKDCGTSDKYPNGRWELRFKSGGG